MNIMDKLILIDSYMARKMTGPVVEGAIAVLTSEIREALPPQLREIAAIKSLPKGQTIVGKDPLPPCQHPSEFVREVMDLEGRPADVTYCFWCLTELGRESWFRRYQG